MINMLLSDTRGQAGQLSLCTGEIEREQATREISPRQKFAAPTLVLMAGFAGVGKTTLAQKLQARLNWKVLNKDDFKLQRLSRGEAVEQAGWNAFIDLFALLEQEACQKGHSVIIDTSNEKPFIFSNILEVLAQMENHGIHTRLKVILCLADKAVRTQRLQARGSVFAPYVQELPTILDDDEFPVRFRHLFDDTGLPERFRHLFAPENVFVVDTNPPVESYFSRVLHEIIS